VQRWQKTVQKTLQRLPQQVRTTVQRARETAQAVRSMAQAAGQKHLGQGLLSICAFCKQIRDQRGTWQRLEAYMQAHYEVQFTHDFCPRCTQRHYGITLPDEADGDERPRGDQGEATWSRTLTGMPHAGGPYDRRDPSTAGAVVGPGISNAAGVRSPNTNRLRIHPATCREDGPPPASRRKG
jgi:phage-related protein